MKPAAIACLVALAVAGCGDKKTEVRRDTDLVFYEKSGGLAGKTSSMSVDANGVAVLSPDSRKVRLRRAELKGLGRAIAKADVPSLPKLNRPRTVPDGFQYTVKAQGETVQAETGAIPRRLQPLLGELARVEGLARRR